jgi:hypothetical protein
MSPVIGVNADIRECIKGSAVNTTGAESETFKFSVIP